MLGEWSGAAPLAGRRDFLAGVGRLGAAALLAVRPEAGPAGPDRPRPDGAVGREMRGVWIATVGNIDWPSAPGLPAEQARAEFTAHLDRAVALGLNAVFVQIRPTADAFWPGAPEPWSQWLTGTQGRDPGWDPLAFMVDAAHRRALAFHGWFNPYRVATQPDPARLAPGHPARLHPEWIASYQGGLYYNPGVPAARRFVVEAMMDAVRRYDLDGVHFDDYFYPYPAPGRAFPDDEAFAAHGSGFTDRAAWRRHNVDLLIREMRDLVREARPEAAFGVSPFGIWRNAATDPAGSRTHGTQSYDDLSADSLGWARDGLVDYLAPQLYWAIGTEGSDYAELAPWWAARTAGSGTQLWIGQAVSRVGDPGRPGAWQDPAELSRHLTLNAGLPQIGGNLLWNATSVWADRLGGVGRMAADHWPRPALGPLLPRLAAAQAPPRPPLAVPGLDDRGRPQLVIHPGGPRPEPFQHAVYRYDTHPGPGPRTDPDRLTALLPGRTRRFTVPTTDGSWYTVTAVDRANRESRPATPVRPSGGLA
ncbi:family 10 glycosylhydrolase [Kitasatospora sp. NPDC048540]|uniref:glycoside hydrolase family 10 protein n=1 Tax=Kitasatospora sp. NPDC048540 TaxID=3155634 RepID=UPI0033CB2AB3